MEKIKNMLTDKKLYFCILIAIVFFGIFCSIEYATDTYTVFENSTKSTVEHFFESGRFVTGICQMIVRGFHFSENLTYTLSFLLAIISLSIALYKLLKIIQEDVNNVFISGVISVLIIINVFSIELFMYIEKGIMVLSILLNVLAVEGLIKYFKGNKKSLIGVFIYMTIANFCYQGTVALFITLAVVYILKYSKNIKEFIKNNIITALLYGLPAVLNYVIVKFVFANSRIAGEVNLQESIKRIIEGSKQMLLTYSIIPKYLFITIIGILLLVILYYIISKKTNAKDKILSICAVIYIILGCAFATILPQLMQATESIWFVPRSSYAFGGILGILILYLFMNFKVNIKLERVIFIGMICYLLVQYVNFQTIAKDHYIVNYMDKYQAMQIGEMINEYEEKTNNKVTKIAFYESENATYTYPNIKAFGDVNIKAIYPSWSRIPYLSYYLDRDFEETEKDAEISKKYFSGKDWKYFDINQVVIIEDTLHLYVY